MAGATGQPVGITIDASGALKKIKLLQSGLEPKDILDTIGARLLRDTGKVLETAGSAPGGVPWVPMKPATIKRRPVRKSNRHFSSPYQTLLQQSMASAVSGNQVEVGTNAKYAAFHHMGGGHLPSRKLLPGVAYAKTAATQVVQAIVDALARSAAGSS
jgi:phage gpG-like protein